MNRFLLTAITSLIVLGVVAQEKSVSTRSISPIQSSKLLTQEMLLNAPAEPVASPRRSSGKLSPYYRRPAGAFYSRFVAKNGVGMNSLDYDVMQMKPFSDYTYYGTVPGRDENDVLVWWGLDMEYNTDMLTENYGIEELDPPLFEVFQNGSPDQVYAFRYPTLFNTQQGNTPVATDQSAAIILSAPSYGYYFNKESVELLLSSKTMCDDGRYGDVTEGLLSRYYGAKPWGDNKNGWWFGKNASHIDGIAQAFEKPQHPYLLKNVYLQANYDMVVNAPVKLTCKVYKLDEIPDYQDVGGVVLSAEPGELITSGEAMVTPTIGEALNGLITFTLFDHDEDDPSLVYEYQPSIDYPILVCIDGYNDPGMENLVDFSASVSTDIMVDEGFGELAYIKQGIFEYQIDETGDTARDQDGNPVQTFTGEYQWRGLNNFFSNGTKTMKTGLSIFIGAEMPFLTFYSSSEDGEYHFPNEGGPLVKIITYPENTVTCEGIKFISMASSEDWTVTCNGNEPPEWLEIELIDDVVDGQFCNEVTAKVTAAPLPAASMYREAVVRFSFPGAYKDYRFFQGEKIGPDPPDPIIPVVNRIVEIILGKKVSQEEWYRCDINRDDEVNISDVNTLIKYFLGIIDKK